MNYKNILNIKKKFDLSLNLMAIKICHKRKKKIMILNYINFKDYNLKFSKFCRKNI